MNGVRAQAELTYDDNKNYNEVCGSNGATQDPNIGAAILAADDANGGAAAPICGTDGTGSADATVWAISSPLKTPGNFYCVDSAGNATSTTLTGVTDGSCL